MRLLTLALPIIVLCGCSKSSSSGATGVTAAEVGVYSLQSLNSAPLPTSISEGGVPVEVTAGTLTLSAGNGLQISTTFRQTPGASPQTRVVSGKYQLTGTSLAFTYTNGGANSGTLNGTTIQMTNEGIVWAYRRN